MAKRKGKAQHRINWQLRFDRGQGDEEVAGRRGLGQRAVKLPPSRVPTEQENVEDLPKRDGMVIGKFPGGVIVHSEGQDLLCSIAKTYRAPEGSTALTVGDNVTVALTRREHASELSQGDKLRADGMILLRQPRATALSRPLPRSGKHRDEYATEAFEKVIVANMDVLLIVVSTASPPLRAELIDRFLIVAERGELRPVVVVNKIDLAPPDEAAVGNLAGMGVDMFRASAASGQGVEAIRQRLAGQRAVLAGPSGVGKSTLINVLVPGAMAVTALVRAKDQRGRHTTAAANVYDLPGGGMIVDTPGVRELGVRLSARDLSWYFPEFEEFAHQCRFSNCIHTHEPNCAVQAAAEAGKILQRRYESYVRILDTLED
jgi:ribosome biogenesis GTPase / thiamine phosphate phosphatase